MNKRKDFNTILNECLDLILKGEATVEQCLQRYPEHAGDLKDLLLTATSVNQAINLKPSPEFKVRARYQLQLKMAEVKTARRVSFWGAQPKWALATMALLVVFLMGGGTVLAADSSMPGSLLYPVKIAAENVSVSLSGTDIKKAVVLAAVAERRVEEMIYVVENGKTKHAEDIARKFEETMTAIDSLALSSQPMLAMAAVSQESFGKAQATENATGQVAPPMLAPAPAPTTSDTTEKPDDNNTTTTRSPAADDNKSSATVTATDTRKSTNITTVLNDKDKLKQYISYNAIHHPEKLTELLKKAPESIKPLIIKMIDDANKNNTQILEELEDDD